MCSFLSAAILLAWALPAGAVPPVPVLDAPRALVVDALTDDVLLEKNADSMTLQGSIAKIVTAGVALSAARGGIVTLNDEVAISARAQEQGCTCLQDTSPADGTSDVQVGEIFLLEGMLHGILMRSAGEVTDATAEHVAAQAYGLAPAAANETGSEILMNLFLGLMNDRVAELGLQNTRFVTVHGGDVCDFWSTGCAPECHDPLLCFLDPECSAGSLCEPSGTTARDLAVLWRDIVEETPEFLDIAGAREAVIPSALNGQLQAYSLSQDFGYAPGVDADKAGNSGLSQASLIAQATWLGRSLVGVVLNASSNGARAADMGALFDFGFQTIFEPDLRATAETSQRVHDHDLVCASPSRAVCVMSTAPQRRLRLATWDVDAGAGEIEPLRRPLPPLLGFVIRLLERFVPGFALPPDFPPSGATLVGRGDVDEVDAAHMGGGVLAVAVRRGIGVQLMTWGIANEGPPFVLHGGVPLGAGTEVRVEALTENLLVSGVRDPEGRLVLRTWRISSDGETIQPLATSDPRPRVREFDLAARALGLTGRLLTVYVNANGDRVRRSWLVTTQQAGFGQIQAADASSAGAGTHVRAVAVPMKLGGGPFDAAFVTAHRFDPGPGAPARLRLVLWSMDSQGELTNLGNSGTTGPALRDPDPQIELAPYREAGVLATVGDGVQARLHVFGLDPENPLDDFTAPFRVAETSQVAGDLLGACRIPGDAAEGDFLLAYEHFFDFGGPLTLSAWRSGPR